MQSDAAQLANRFEEALRSTDRRQALRALALALSAEGYKRNEIVDAFGEFHAQLRDSNREEEENIVADVMDMLVGWFPPHNIDLPE